MTTRQHLDAARMFQIQEALQARPHSIAELSEIAGLSRPLIAKHLRELRHTFGCVFVAEWAEGLSGRQGTVAKFKWGDLMQDADAPRPPAPTAAQRMAKSRAARKETA